MRKITAVAVSWSFAGFGDDTKVWAIAGSCSSYSETTIGNGVPLREHGWYFKGKDAAQKAKQLKERLTKAGYTPIVSRF